MVKPPFQGGTLFFNCLILFGKKVQESKNPELMSSVIELNQKVHILKIEDTKAF